MRLVSDNASTTLTADINDSATTLPLADASRFPVVVAPDYALASIEDSAGNIEIVKIVSRSAGSNSPTVVRGQDGTAPAAFSSSDRVEIRTTASLFEMFYQKGVDDSIDADSEIDLFLNRMTVVGQVPANGELIEGELAINIPDRKIWVGAVGSTGQNNLPPILISDNDQSATLFEVIQFSHGFNVGQPIYFNGTSWQLAIANAEATLGTHVVGEVRSVDAFVAVTSGLITGIDWTDILVAPIVPGTVYYVNTGTSGRFTPTKPTNSDKFINAMLIGYTSTSMIMMPWRGYPVTRPRTYALATSGASIPLASNAWTKLTNTTLNTLTFNDLGSWSGGIWTCPESGRYRAKLTYGLQSQTDVASTDPAKIFTGLGGVYKNSILQDFRFGRIRIPASYFSDFVQFSGNGEFVADLFAGDQLQMAVYWADGRVNGKAAYIDTSSGETSVFIEKLE